MKTALWEIARYWVLILLVALLTLSSHPRIVAMSQAAGIEVGTILSRYIIFVFGALFVMCFNLKSMLQPKFVRACWVIFILIGLYFLITLAVYGDRTMMSDLRSIAICLVSIMIGWQMRLSERRFWWLLMAFSGFTLFVGLMQVFTNVGGFIISDQYLTDNKNALGVLLASTTVVLVLLGMNQRRTIILKIIILSLAVLSFFILLTIRARGSTVTVLLMLLYIFYERFKGRNFVVYLLGVLILLVIVLMVLPDSFIEYFTDSFTLNREGDITSGRAQRNQAGLSFLAQYPLFGNLGKNVDVGIIHNYLLNRTFAFGLVFVFPIFLMFVFILVFDIKRSICANNRENGNIGYYLLLIPFIISMAEYSFPYGPGTATVFNFLLFGMSLKYTANSELFHSSDRQILTNNP